MGHSFLFRNNDNHKVGIIHKYNTFKKIINARMME